MPFAIIAANTNIGILSIIWINSIICIPEEASSVAPS
jgi:hypothetical protein